MTLRSLEAFITVWHPSHTKPQWLSQVMKSMLTNKVGEQTSSWLFSQKPDLIWCYQPACHKSAWHKIFTVLIHRLSLAAESFCQTSNEDLGCWQYRVALYSNTIWIVDSSYIWSCQPWRCCLLCFVSASGQYWLTLTADAMCRPTVRWSYFVDVAVDGVYSRIESG